MHQVISVDNTRGPVGTRGTGNVISFSGGSKIRSSVTFLNKSIMEIQQHLQSRNLDYKSNTFKSKYPGVNYYDTSENYVVQEYNWPDDTELTSSLYKGKSCKIMEFIIKYIINQIISNMVFRAR